MWEYLKFLVSILKKSGICYGSKFQNCRSRVGMTEVNLQLNWIAWVSFCYDSCTLYRNVNKAVSYSFHMSANRRGM